MFELIGAVEEVIDGVVWDRRRAHSEYCVFFRREVVEERPTRNACPIGDGTDRRLEEAVLLNEVDGRIVQTAQRFGALPLAEPYLIFLH